MRILSRFVKFWRSLGILSWLWIVFVAIIAISLSYYRRLDIYDAFLFLVSIVFMLLGLSKGV